MPKHEVYAITTISSHDSYHGWPTAARLSDGDLLAVVSAGREGHVCPFGQVHLIRSRDNGKTWSRPEILANGPLDDRDAGILQTSRGTVLVNWFTSIAWLRKLELAEEAGDDDLRAMGDGFTARCRKVRSLLSDDVINAELGTWMLRSSDKGRSWSEKIDCGAGSPHGPTELADGRLLFVGNFKNDKIDIYKCRSPYTPELGAVISEDDGLSWKRLSTIPQRPGDEPGTYHEPHAVQASDGRIIVHIRNHSEQDKGFILQTESDDGGKNFGVPRNTGIQGLPPHLLRLRDGRLLCTYGYRILPYGNRAVLSEDNGCTWSEPMVLDEKPVARDLGYPSTVELEDGSLLSIWYERLPDDINACVRSAHWSLTG